MSPEVQEITEGFTGNLELVLAEDDEMIRKNIISYLRKSFGDRIGRVLVVSTANGVRELIGDGLEHRFWVTDFTLDEEKELPWMDLEPYLKGQSEHTTAWAVMSGNIKAIRSTMDSFSALVAEETPGNLQRIFCQKPFSRREFAGMVGPLLDHLEGIESLARVDEEPPEVEAKEEVTVRDHDFPHALRRVESFMGLVGALPSSAEKVTHPDAAYDLCGHIAREFSELAKEVASSYCDFETRWMTHFPRDEFNPRNCFLGILRSLPGAEYVLDICLHDINNILGRFSERVPDKGEWPAVQREIFKLLKSAWEPFDKYHKVPTLERPFWEKKNVHEVLEQARDQFTLVSIIDVPDDILVDCPVGSLRSILRTFYSNFSKVSRLNRQNDAELELFVYIDGGKIVFQVSDNLKEFEDDRLDMLFEEGIRSEEGAFGMGTGLARTAEIIDISGGEISSYHYRAEQERWVQKNPGSEVTLIERSQVPLCMKEGMRKVFQFSLPIAA